MIPGKPDTSRGVRPVWRGVLGNLPQQCGKALGAYPTGDGDCPHPLASFAGQPSSSIGVAFLKSYAAICLEGCVIVLACVIFSAFASSPPAITDSTLAPATIVWNYIGELIFNMLVLVGAIKMSDRLIRELMGLG